MAAVARPGGGGTSAARELTPTPERGLDVTPVSALSQGTSPDQPGTRDIEYCKRYWIV